ncbi:hypothetical protein [Streptomyces sp. NPDC006134]|uniref:hypothetical protein n=1 Tax=Streptomyces sp. NPDC006134 TaxID=3154467 RepID=UPI0033F029D1
MTDVVIDEYTPLLKPGGIGADAAGWKSTGRWTVQAALGRGTPSPSSTPVPSPGSGESSGSSAPRSPTASVASSASLPPSARPANGPLPPRHRRPGPLREQLEELVTLVENRSSIRDAPVDPVDVVTTLA